MESSAQQDEESFAYAMQIASSSVLPVSMNAAIELQLFEIIAKAGPNAKLSPKEMAAQLGSKNPDAPSMLDRILRVLASHRIVGCSLADDEERLYSLTPVSKFYVPNEDGVSLASFMTLVQDKTTLDSWSELKDAILQGGIPFEKVYGTNPYEYCGKDPRWNRVFNTAMMDLSTIVMNKILETYKGFDRLNRVVDVGGGIGVTLNIITSKYPSIKGINFDLPHVIQHAPAYPGVEHVGGDMFEYIPKGDAIFMKGVLHNWSDEACLKLLKNCYNAIPDDGKVIVVDSVLPIAPETNAFCRGTWQVDVLMMTVTPGGKERTKPKFEALATKAGFSGIRYECFDHSIWVMEFLK